LSYVLYTGYCPLLFSVVHQFQISETKYESLCDESITTIKKREKTLIDGITKHSQKLQNEIELERKTVKQTIKYNLYTQDDHRIYRINTSSLSYVLYTGYCPLLFSVVHLEHHNIKNINYFKNISPLYTRCTPILSQRL
jgi:hypothetical protein